MKTKSNLILKGFLVSLLLFLLGYLMLQQYYFKIDTKNISLDSNNPSELKIKILSTDFNSFDRICNKFGLSILIGDDLLFDTFSDGKTLMRNFKKMGVDPKKIKYVFISHDDWDHIGGLWEFLKINSDVTVYLCQGTREEVKRRIRSFNPRIVEVLLGQPVLIKEGFYSSGENTISFGQSLGGVLTEYEQSLVIKTPKGLIIVTGCAHPRVSKIIKKVESDFKQPAYLLMGGFHLSDKLKDRELVDDELKGIFSSEIKYVVPLHCTGSFARKNIKEKYGKNNIEVSKITEINIK